MSETGQALKATPQEASKGEREREREGEIYCTIADSRLDNKLFREEQGQTERARRLSHIHEREG